MPTAAETPAQAETTPTLSVEQANEASATAVATASSDAVQIVSQTTEGAEAPLQIVLQELNVVQVASARAVADLSEAANVSLHTGGTTSQASRAAAEVEAQIASTIVQQIAQYGGGEDSLQTQAALQSTLTTQVLGSVGVATLVGGLNTGLSVGGTSTQATDSSAAAAGAETSAVRQTIEQEQAGSDAEQEQVAGQWSEVVQDLDLIAAAGLHDATNESRLRDEASSLRVGTQAESTGSSRSAITQLAIQLQNGDETALQQESLQQAIVEQTGVGLAAATAGTIRLVYATPPPSAALRAAEPAPEAATAPVEPPALVEPPAHAVTVAPTVFIVVDLPPSAGGAGRTAGLYPPRPGRAPHRAGRTRAAELSAPAGGCELRSNQASGVPHRPHGRLGPERGRGRREGRGPLVRRPCVAPLAGAAAVTAGNGSGSAFVALPGNVLSPLPRLGRRVFEPAGRRPAAVVSLRARPG